jgi:hypothetical protein
VISQISPAGDWQRKCRCSLESDHARCRKLEREREELQRLVIDAEREGDE